MAYEVPAEDVAMMNQHVFGAKPVVKAEFYEHEALDVTASRDAGQRITTRKDYIHLTCKKEGGEMRRPVQKIDIQRYPAEWGAYQRSKENEPRDVPDISTERPSIGAAFTKAQAG